MGCSPSTVSDYKSKSAIAKAVIHSPQGQSCGHQVIADNISRGRPHGRFQIQLGGEWKDYAKYEDAILKQAFLVGHSHCKFSLRGQHYEYDFKRMKQTNVTTHKQREIRPPRGLKAPAVPLLPKGPMMVVTVRQGQAGTTIQIDDPNNEAQQLSVKVPSGARVGQKLAVPLPEPDKRIADLQEEEQQTGAHSTTAKVASTSAAVAAAVGLTVGGVVLGDHLSGGGLGAADLTADAVRAVEIGGDDAVDAAPDMAEAIGDVGAEAVDWTEGALDDAGDYFGDAADDAGDFIMRLF